MTSALVCRDRDGAGRGIRVFEPADRLVYPVRSFLRFAVLALQNVGGDSANEPFSDGMSDEITTALRRVEGLQVAARSSAFSFKGKDIVPREIGRRLQVRYVLDGGRSGERGPTASERPAHRRRGRQ